MEIHEFLRAKRMKAGYTYASMAEKANRLGHNTSTQALNKAERIPQYIAASTKAMYMDVLKLSSEEVDALDVLAARCQIRKGSQTNPYMTVVDSRVYQEAVSESCAMVLSLLEGVLSKDNISLTSSEEDLITAALKGTLCRPLYQITRDSS